MPNTLGFTQEGLSLATKVKRDYKSGDPITVPGDDKRILLPEYLLNRQIHLEGFEDPLPLALVSTRDPESPMAISAAIRLSPLAGKKKLIRGVFDIVKETTKHDAVRKCIDLVTEHDFDPAAIKTLSGHASQYVKQARERYSIALKNNLKALMDGELEPRIFVEQFFALTEAGNLRQEIRKKLVVSLLTAPNIRPSIKFLFLENFERFPAMVRDMIVRELMATPDRPHMDMIRDELKWMAAEENVFGAVQ